MLTGSSPSHNNSGNYFKGVIQPHLLVRELRNTPPPPRPVGVGLMPLYKQGAPLLKGPLTVYKVHVAEPPRSTQTWGLKGLS